MRTKQNVFIGLAAAPVAATAGCSPGPTDPTGIVASRCGSAVIIRGSGASSAIGSAGHELGHSMGLYHEWSECLAADDCSLPPKGWEFASAAHGYVQFYRNATRVFGTIMTYGTPCAPLGIPASLGERVPRFAKPLINENGLPFGIPQGQPCPSDEVGVLNDGRLFDVANRRKSVCRMLSSC